MAMACGLAGCGLTLDTDPKPSTPDAGGLDGGSDRDGGTGLDAGTADTGVADGGVCPSDCDDGIACTEDVCTGSTCAHEPDDLACEGDRICDPEAGCVCPPQTVDCGGAGCLPECCPGDETTEGCDCARSRECDETGHWGPCPSVDPECTPGAEEGCCGGGTRTCTNRCEWGGCSTTCCVCDPGSTQCFPDDANPGCYKIENCREDCLSWVTVEPCADGC